MADIDVNTGMEAKEKLEREHGKVKEDVKKSIVATIQSGKVEDYATM